MSTTTEPPRTPSWNPQTGILRVSYSSIDAFKQCKLKWYWAEVQGIPRKETASAKLGTEVHELAENYLRDGKQPHEMKAGAILRAGLHLLPKPGTVRVEEWVRINIAGSPLNGKIDWFDTADIKLWWVADHKTTSNLTYALTEDQLKYNWQPNIYSFALMTLRNETPARFKFTHIYYTTKGLPKAHPVHAFTTPRDVRETMVRVESAVKHMQDLACQPDPAKVLNDPKRANTEACGAYGGCPYAERCPFSPINEGKRLQAVAVRALTAPTTQEQDMGRASKLLGNDEGQVKGETHMGANPPDAPPQTPSTEVLEQEFRTRIEEMLGISDAISVSTIAKAQTLTGVSDAVKDSVLADLGLVLTADRSKMTKAGGAAQAKPEAPSPAAAAAATPEPPPPAEGLNEVAKAGRKSKLARYVSEGRRPRHEVNIQTLAGSKTRAYDLEGETLEVGGVKVWASQAEALAAVCPPYRFPEVEAYNVATPEIRDTVSVALDLLTENEKVTKAQVRERVASFDNDAWKVLTEVGAATAAFHVASGELLWGPAPTPVATGRTRKAKNTDAPATAQTSAAPAAGSDTAGESGDILFVDCIPLGVGIRHVDEVVEEQVRKVLDTYRTEKGETVPDIGLVEFGKGGALVASQVMVAWMKDGRPGGWLRIESRHPLADALIPKFAQAGFTVVRALRG